MTEVVKFYPANAAEDPDAVLEQAVGAYSNVLILGWDADEEFDARSSLGLSKADALMLVEVFRHNLVSGAYDQD